MLRNIHLGAVTEGLYRQDVYEIPHAAIRDLIINAAVHRSYLDNGNIQVAIFDKVRKKRDKLRDRLRKQRKKRDKPVKMVLG